MSMTQHIFGFKPVDEKWREMKQVWDACKIAHVEIPDEVCDFFDGQDPNNLPGIEVDLEETEAVDNWGDEGRSGFEVDLSKLPDDIKFLRIYVAY